MVYNTVREATTYRNMVYQLTATPCYALKSCKLHLKCSAARYKEKSVIFNWQIDWTQPKCTI